MNKRNSFFRRGKLASPKVSAFLINKRQKFVASVILLSLGLFFSVSIFGRFNLFLLIFLSLFANFLFLLSNFSDVKGKFSWNIFILPLLYTLSFGLFYSLIPSRILSKLLITIVYAIGLYSLFLSQNIFVVASVRTISLITSARIVSLVLTLITYFFLSNVIFSLHLPLLPLAGLIFVFSFLLVNHSLWTHSLDKSFTSRILWGITLSLCLLEVSVLLFFWPSNPTLIALFLAGFFYTIVGITQVWFDKRLFKGVLWEYIWVAVLVFCILMLFSSWK